MYDILIVGAGPAAVSAALTARQRGRSAIVVGNDFRESPLAKAPLVSNYPGLAGGGLELLEAMHGQLREAGVPVVNRRVLQAAPLGGAFACAAGQDCYEGRTLLLCTGQPRGRALKGESDYLGRGVSCCATCDGMLYRGKDVLVLGEGSEAVDDANFLQNIGCRVRFFARGSRPENLAGPISFRQARSFAVVGDGTRMTALEADGEICPGDALFLLRPTVAAERLLRGLHTEEGRIVTDRTMATSVPGVFAAGDCVGKPYQLAKAVGEGNIAALSADQWLTQKKGVR